jgi:ABC-2 type transport system permease protein
MTAFLHHFGFEFRTGVRNRSLLLLTYLFPLGFYLMMGFIMPQINPLFRDSIIPVMILFAVLAAALLGLPDPLVSAREAGIFRSYKINGVPARAIIVIPALSITLHLTIVAALIAFSAPFLFDAPTPQNWLGLVLIFIVSAFALTGLGALIGIVSPNSRTTILLSQAVFLPSMLVGGMMIPYAMLPDSVRALSRLLPTTYAMEAYNALALGQSSAFDPWLALLVLASAGLLAFGLAHYLFSWDSQNSMRRGHPALALLALAPYIVAALFLG